MKNAKKIISLFLVFSFLLILGVQFYSQSNHRQASRNSTQDIELVSNDSAEMNCFDCGIENSGAADSDHNKKCPDPCHLGQSHFGHSTFPLSIANVPLLAVLQSKNQIQFVAKLTEDPHIEGLRRPPRHC